MLSFYIKEFIQTCGHFDLTLLFLCCLSRTSYTSLSCRKYSGRRKYIFVGNVEEKNNYITPSATCSCINVFVNPGITFKSANQI